MRDAKGDSSGGGTVEEEQESSSTCDDCVGVAHDPEETLNVVDESVSASVNGAA